MLKIFEKKDEHIDVLVLSIEDSFVDMYMVVHHILHIEVGP